MERLFRACEEAVDIPVSVALFMVLHVGLA